MQMNRMELLHIRETGKMFRHKPSQTPKRIESVQMTVAEQLRKWFPRNIEASSSLCGKTPMIHIDRFAEIGYDLVIYPVTMQRIAMNAVTAALTRLRDEGGAEGLLDDMQTRKELYDLLGYVPGSPWSFPGNSSAE